MTHTKNEEKRAQPVILFDGLCNFCNAIVNFIIKHDSKKVFLFAPIQTKEARALLRERNEAFASLKTVYLIEGTQVYKRSKAIFKIFRLLPYPWRVFSTLGILPGPVTDLFYKLVAKYRYQLFGKRESLVQPREEVKERYLSKEILSK